MKKKVRKTKTPIKVKKKKRRKKKILIPRIVRFTRTCVSEMYGLKCKIKRAKGYKPDSKAHTITMYSPTGIYLGELGLHKNELAGKKLWLIFGSKSGVFCSGGKTDKVLKYVKSKIMEEFKGKVL